jgi:acyl-CoA dehydrogenase
MDLSFQDDDLTFRDDVRRFLDQALTPALRQAGRNRTSVFQEKESALAWQAVLYEKGWLVPDWPVEWGGTGWSVMQRYIFSAECARAEAPMLYPSGILMCGPALIAYGTAEQKDHYLPRILNGEHFWCQGYSEPGSGSDLASLRTQAVADGDDYVINGTKIWTTFAHHANQMFCLVRTDNATKPQAGISFLLIDMATPGITVEPIITMAGDHELNQVFFDDVRVPKTNRVGAENDGWTVAKYLLEFERQFMPASELRRAFDRVRRLSSDTDAGADGGGFTQRLARLDIAVETVQMGELRLLATLGTGGRPGAAASTLTIQKAELKQQINALGVEALGLYGAVHQPEALSPASNQPPVGPADGAAMTPTHLNERMLTIAGGSAEIQRNIVAKAVLGL